MPRMRNFPVTHAVFMLLAVGIDGTRQALRECGLETRKLSDSLRRMFLEIFDYNERDYEILLDQCAHEAPIRATADWLDISASTVSRRTPGLAQRFRQGVLAIVMCNLLRLYEKAVLWNDNPPRALRGDSHVFIVSLPNSSQAFAERPTRQDVVVFLKDHWNHIDVFGPRLGAISGWRETDDTWKLSIGFVTDDFSSAVAMAQRFHESEVLDFRTKSGLPV
ncbi:MAG: hypothetical protein KDA93_09670 [Planctomycetaceae bacterium]|nr:hypothetical protein [Planctomycetaceae bacterium]